MSNEYTDITELDVIFISYDEDNAEDNWADLLTKVPWAKRVHGVYGSDAAHKAAARESETDRFISVDADNIVDESFFDQKFNWEHPTFKDKVVSWSARNHINGLEYGNGGLKCWPVQYVLDMKTHENSASDDKMNQIEFCWEDSYVQMNNMYCNTFPNGSPRQAFRAGFREGVKMSLDQGERVDPDLFKQTIWKGNLRRLQIWCSIGADVDNGLWAIYGARLGCQMTNLTDWDFVNVRDFEYINELWHTKVMPEFEGKTHKCVRTGYAWDNDKLVQKVEVLGNQLRKELGMDIAELNGIQSKFFKATYNPLPRMNNLMTEVEYNKLRDMNA